MATDLLLSSGFLAFARHAGVLQAIEERGVGVEAVVGTSSGALVGALWAAGMPSRHIEAEIAAKRPLSLMALHAAPWRGLFSLAPLIAWLRAKLPADFAGLPRPFAVGTTAPGGRATLVRDGPLPEAVAASCAMPWVFAAIPVAGEPHQDGGAVDRLMVGPWRDWRPGRSAVAHLVARTAGVDSDDPLDGVTVIRTARSGASFWSLGDVAAQAAEARAAALATLDEAGRSVVEPSTHAG